MDVLTCFMAVTVITKKRGRPLVTGEVGVSIISWKDKYRGRSGETSGEISTTWKCKKSKKEKKDDTRVSVGVDMPREKTSLN